MPGAVRLVATVGAALAALAIGCTDAPDRGRAAGTSPPAASAPPTVTATAIPDPTGSASATLPPDELVPLVPGIEDVPTGMELVPDTSGPAGPDEISSYSTDPEKVKHELEEQGFEDGYQVQYQHPGTGAIVSAYVVRYASEDGARAAFAREVAESALEADKFAISGLGDEVAGFRHSVPGGDVTDVIILRVRLARTTWMVQHGGPDRADEALARRIAETLLDRAA